jgi:hypothetical protein
MYYITQVLQRKDETGYAMFLGFNSDLKTSYYLNEALEEVSNQADSYKPFEPYPFLLNVGFFGCVNLDDLFKATDDATLKKFIKSGGVDNEAKEALVKQIDNWLETLGD